MVCAIPMHVNESGLFEKVVELTGLSPLLAPGTVRRALAGAGIESDVAFVTREDYLRALPQLKRRLAVYLPPEEAERRSDAIRALLEQGEQE